MCIHYLKWHIRGNLGMTHVYEVKLKLVDGSSNASDHLVKSQANVCRKTIYEH